MPSPVLRVFVTCNAEQYRVIDISGAPDGAHIRERIFAKINIPEARRPLFKIYQSDIGGFAHSDALSDTALFELCHRHGDAAGTLKFFISTAPDRPPSGDYEQYLQ
ncbi:uncharacterized protein SCHCODRAFT_02643671 [Schizophyllum commune H4-8]|uniref:uncharacterized protein n=1 Tax=Schizophyllum commune (strain H4-8 / FGSC 9210) TaxID=578458 RepID=UPI00215DEF75|nr:uncharacterized protein SCHCODRAFT_02643671 [Schizophyllum commune H4-8]KAI5885519.1 hypothetical protein SCHCODRAFT_02643671 [Schizophyllum commune H4-8]